MTHWWPVHGEDEIEAVAVVLRSGKTNMWTGSPGEVFAFEREYAEKVMSRHALAVTNGTTALELALRALRLPLGSEVVVPCRTFVACAAAVHTVGLTPVLADIGMELNVTAETVCDRLTDRTGAVMVVHYAGLPVKDMNEIRAECSARRVSLIEDCSHAHGAEVGGWGDVSTWSFCQGKIISTGGEGGMVTTDNPVLAARMAAFRDHGRYQMTGKIDTKEFQWTVEELGSNLRMTEMQAAIGRVQLRKLDERRARRLEIMRAYRDAVGVGRMFGGNRLDEHAGYMFVFDAREVDERAVASRVPHNGRTLRERLFAEVEHARWGGCHNIGHEKALLDARGWCPVAEAIGSGTVSLPVYPTMTDEDVEQVVAQVKRVMGA